jgi:hypothetical protein
LVWETRAEGIACESEEICLTNQTVFLKAGGTKPLCVRAGRGHEGCGKIRAESDRVCQALKRGLADTPGPQA